MDYRAEQHRSRTFSYDLEQDQEDVENMVDRFLELLGEEQGLELLGADSEEGGGKDYSFTAVGSSANVFYTTDSEETDLEIEVYGAAPLVDRIYSNLSEGLEPRLQ
jgi:hypothetical protein